MSDDTLLDYASAGVDTCAGDRAVELMKEAVSRTHEDARRRAPERADEEGRDQ